MKKLSYVHRSTQGINDHFNAYYENDSLLLQFILAEFLRTQQLANHIQKLLQYDIHIVLTSAEITHTLSQFFGQLVGCVSQKNFSPWIKGSLTKLKEYSEYFLLNSTYRHKKYMKLHVATQQAWLSAIHQLELLSSYQMIYLQHEGNLHNYTFFKKNLNSLQKYLSEITRYLPYILLHYLNNENVVLYVLRKKNELAGIYGPDFLQKYFKWPTNFDALEKWLIQRYQARGFDHLIPVIKELLLMEEVVV